MPTTIDELIEALQTIREDIAATIGDEDRAGEAEVRLAVQPAWPFQHHVSGELTWRVDDAGDAVAYVGEAGQVSSAPYLPGDVAEALGWR
jgi:hypothetical protein